jgi:LysM repeat protein
LAILPTMNAADAGDALAEPTPQPPAPAVDPAVEAAVPRGCPFLIAEPGGWRLDVPSRDHRCAAFAPSAPLAPEKQARLCLTPTHTECATFLASLEARRERLGAPTEDRATRWGLARTTTVIEDTGGLRARATAALLDRRRWPAVPAIILVTTLLTLALSGFRGFSPTPAATSGPVSPKPSTTTSPTSPPVPTGTPLASAPPSTAPTTAPTPTLAATPAPSVVHRTYRVKAGDTLSAIASRFGVSIESIVRLNNLRNPNDLSIGQLLLIP